MKGTNTGEAEAVVNVDIQRKLEETLVTWGKGHSGDRCGERSRAA